MHTLWGVGMLLLLLLSVAMGQEVAGPADPDKLQRSMAAVNLRRFPEALLLDALVPDDQHHVSAERIALLLESPEGQQRARAAAMRMILAEGGEGSERSRGDGSEMGWLDTMCEAMPWLSWLLACSSDPAEEDRGAGEGLPQPEPPFTLMVDRYQWASCHSAEDL